MRYIRYIGRMRSVLPLLSISLFLSCAHSGQDADVSDVRKELQKQGKELRQTQDELEATRSELRDVQNELRELKPKLAILDAFDLLTEGRLSKPLSKTMDREMSGLATNVEVKVPSALLKEFASLFTEEDKLLPGQGKSWHCRIVPWFNGGDLDGFRIFAIRPGSRFQQLGFENGDVVRRVNGKSSFQKVDDRTRFAIIDIDVQTPIKVELVRRGKPIRLSIEDAGRGK